MKPTPHRRAKVAQPPQGWKRLTWMGPGILWALSSVGAGEIYYSARVGARYRYELLWAGWLTAIFTWVIIREIGRYTVVTSETIMHGYRDMPGPKRWPVWFLFCTQCVDLATNTAGHAALSASILVLVLPGPLLLFAIALILAAAAVVVLGAYGVVNRVSAVLAFVLLAAALVTVARVFPGIGTFAGGFVPSAPSGLDLYFVLPWVGFLLIHGAPWFSYWVGKEGFGGGLKHPLDELATDEPFSHEARRAGGGEEGREGREAEGRLRTWLHLMSAVGGLGTAIGGIFFTIFIILGAELLGGGTPAAGTAVGRELARGIRDAWGALGFWLFLVTAAGSFWTTVLDVDDGAVRLLADSTLILLPDRFVRGAHPGGRAGEDGSADDAAEGRVGADRREVAREPAGEGGQARDTLGQWLLARQRLINLYVVILATVIPIGLLLLVGQPMKILAVTGIISAMQAPFFAFFTLWTNHRLLPEEYRPGWISSTALVLAGLFFAAASTLYLLSLLGFKPLGGG